jgi:hypothetical protein
VGPAIGQPVEAVSLLLELLETGSAGGERWRKVDSAITCRLEGVIPVDRPVVDSGRVGTECAQEFGGSLNVKPEAWCCREVWGWQHGSGLGGGGEGGE